MIYRGIATEIGHADNIYCDNQVGINDLTLVESRLNNKNISVEYHYMWYAASEKIITTSWINMRDNIEDKFTKRISKMWGITFWETGNVEQTASGPI